MSWMTGIATGVGAALGSETGKRLLDAGTSRAENEILRRSGFEDPMNEAPNAPIAAPKPPPAEEKPEKKPLPKWVVPAAIGGGVLLIGGILLMRGGQ